MRIIAKAKKGGLPEDALDGMGHGTFNDAKVRALVYHIAGHELHHINLIKTWYQ